MKRVVESIHLNGMVGCMLEACIEREFGVEWCK